MSPPLPSTNAGHTQEQVVSAGMLSARLIKGGCHVTAPLHRTLCDSDGRPC